MFKHPIASIPFLTRPRCCISSANTLGQKSKEKVLVLGSKLTAGGIGDISGIIFEIVILLNVSRVKRVKRIYKIF